MTGGQSIVDLKQQVLATLQMNADSFHYAFEITKTGDPTQIDENTYKKLQTDVQKRQYLYDTIKFFGENYNEDRVDDNFAFDLISQLIGIDKQKCNHNVAIECLCIFINMIFPKIATNWSDETKKKLITVIKERQEFILSSADYSPRVKDQITELLVSMKLRFHSDVKIKEDKGRENFTIDDLRNFSGALLKNSFMNNN